jgi:hypothetical protein
MKNLRGVGGLIAIGALLSCATAINDGVPDSLPQTVGPAQGGDGTDPEGQGGAPAAGGAPESAGTPGSAGKGEAGKGAGGGVGSGGKGGGAAGSTSKGGSTGSGGTVGVGGAIVAAGGKAGAGSSAAGDSSGGVGGGSTTAGYCDNPVDLPATATNTGNIGKAAACFRTKAVFNAITCSSMDDRTVKVNGALAKCSTVSTFPPAIDGWSYFDITAGAVEWAQVGWYKG